MTSTITTSSLTKIYGKQKALNSVDISVPKGGIYALVGQNGAGKTTLIKIIAGLCVETIGSYTLLEKESSNMKGIQEARKRVGTVIEAPALFNLSAKENLKYYCIQKGIKDKSVIQRALKLVNLTDTGKKKFKNFSLGMKQRLGLALAILENPELLILDEPINGLDPTGIVEMRGMFKSLSDEGITILISSHILSELELIATNYGFIHKGRLVTQMTASNLREKCKKGFEIRTDDIERAKATALKFTPDINTGATTGKSEDTITLYNLKTDTSDVIRTFVNDNLKVFSAAEVGQSLEDFYIDMVRREDIIRGNDSEGKK